ncbi:glycoside hydrolase family 20 zincin-like fold domain-containing protein [Streptomyces sp. MS1.AVA.1]|uniref:Glycoside hydrolase family 20 zincin-like fold domain-containing protein n=1 Tax=Streptomyces machairae TaxID=3134109 RepID=A0ABU8UTD9_9ACTN
MLLFAAPVPALAEGDRGRRSRCRPWPTGRRHPAVTHTGAPPAWWPGSAGERRVAGTLADDLNDAGHGRVPVVRGGARTGDIVIDVQPSRTSLGAEGYQLRADERLSVTAATETGAFYGTRTLLQLLAQGDRIPAGHTVDVPRYKERGVGVCACYINISMPWLENLVREMAYHKLNQLLLELKVKSEAHPEANTWGYYTKDEIRRLVALGKRYHVEIIPEINSRGTWTRGSRTARISSSPTPTATSSPRASTSPGRSPSPTTRA